MHPRSLDQAVPPSERKVHHALQLLDDPWQVFHGIAWQSPRNGRQGDGEADFVLLHPQAGLIVLEVKGGGIRVAGGKWTSDGAAGRHGIKNPYEQATASQHALVGFLRDADPKLPFLDAGHAVAFPDVGGAGGLGPAASPAITLSRGDLTDAGAFVDRVVTHWDLSADLRPDQVESIVRLLAPTLVVERRLSDDVADAKARIITLTAEQVRVFEGLRRNRRVTVFGGAGTGKTVLAMEQARRLAASGFHTLLTCYNRPLADHLEEQLRDVDGIQVTTFHGQCRRMMDKAGMPFPDPVADGWWDERAPDALVEAARTVGEGFDAIVVDEGQDFSPEMFLALEMLLSRPDSPRFVFADDHQAIYRDDWEPPLDGVVFDLKVNCRNTLPIAGTVARIFDDPPVTEGASGPDPELITVQSPEGIPKALGAVLRRVIDEGGISPAHVAVIAQRKETVEALRGTTLAGVSLVQPIDSTTVAATRSDGGAPARSVLIETIHRFKGLEADVVIVILSRLETDRDRSLAYIGTSRACAHLVVIAPPEVHAALSADAADSR